MTMIFLTSLLNQLMLGLLLNGYESVVTATFPRLVDD